MKREELVACICSGFTSLQLPDVLHAVIIGYLTIHEKIQYRPSNSDRFFFDGFTIDTDFIRMRRKRVGGGNTVSTSWRHLLDYPGLNDLVIVRGSYRYRYAKRQRRVLYIVRLYDEADDETYNYSVSSEPTDVEWFELRKRVRADRYEGLGEYVLV